MGSSIQAVTVSRVDEREEHVDVEQELADDEPPPPSDMGRLDAVLRIQRAMNELDVVQLCETQIISASTYDKRLFI